MATGAFDGIQVRVARPAGDFAAVVAFYRETLGLPVIGSFDDHDGYEGVIFGLPDASCQLEIVRNDETSPSPTLDDQLVFGNGTALCASSIRTGIGSCFPPKPGSQTARPYGT